MKKINIFLSIIFCFLFISCASTPQPSEIEYKEISLKQYLNKSDSKLYSSRNIGYKVTDVYIEKKKKDNILYFEIGRDKFLNATDYIIQISKTDSSWFDRFESVTERGYKVYDDLLFKRSEDWKTWKNTKYNGHFTLYIYKSRGKIHIYKIEGVPTKEQLVEDKIEYANSLGLSIEDYEKSFKEEPIQEEKRKNLRIYLLSGVPIPSLKLGEEISIDSYTSFQMRVVSISKKNESNELLVGHYDYTSQKKYIYIISKQKDISGNYKLKYVGNADYFEYDAFGEIKTINTYVFERID